MTEQFVASNPTLIIIAIGLMAGFIKLLIMAVSKLITQPFNNLATAIKTLSDTMAKMEERMEKDREQAKNDREKDRSIVGSLLDRMQAQETKCATIRMYCPHSGHHPADTSNYAD